MKLKILSVEKMIEVDPEEDPLRYYKTPGLNYLYFKRLQLPAKLLKNTKVDKLLDLGYGCGIMLPELALRCNKLYGIDKHGKDKIVGNILKGEGINAELVDADILEMPFEDSTFECITCISVLDHIMETEKAVSEVYRVLTKQGKFIVGLVSQNILTDIGFSAIGAKTDIYHVSKNLDIIKTISSKFRLSRNISFPFFVPKKYRLYNCWEFVKE